MTSIQIGPLSLPLAPLLVIVAWLVAQQVAAWAARGDRRAGAAGAVSTAGLVGLLASRLAYVIGNRDVYLDTPLAMVDFRDGGWSPWIGIAAGLAWLASAAWRKRAPARALGIGAAVGLAAWLGGGAWLVSQQATRLPELALQRLGGSGTEVFTRAFAGRPFVVNLWATWCAPCREEMPAFAQAQLDRPQVPIVFVNQGEPEARVRGYLSTLPRVDPAAAPGAPPLRHVWLDVDSSLGRAIESRGLPTTVFVDAQGRVARIHAGVMNRAALRAQIDAMR
jgi:thiol-disulfide isomerase/thioredoxin